MISARILGKTVFHSSVRNSSTSVGVTEYTPMTSVTAVALITEREELLQGNFTHFRIKLGLPQDGKKLLPQKIF